MILYRAYNPYPQNLPRTRFHLKKTCENMLIKHEFWVNQCAHLFWVKFAEIIFFLQIHGFNDFYNIRVKNRPYDFSILKKLKTY